MKTIPSPHLKELLEELSQLLKKREEQTLWEEGVFASLLKRNREELASLLE